MFCWDYQHCSKKYHSFFERVKGFSLASRNISDNDTKYSGYLFRTGLYNHQYTPMNTNPPRVRSGWWRRRSVCFHVFPPPKSPLAFPAEEKEKTTVLQDRQPGRHWCSLVFIGGSRHPFWTVTSNENRRRNRPTDASDLKQLNMDVTGFRYQEVWTYIQLSN